MKRITKLGSTTSFIAASPSHHAAAIRRGERLPVNIFIGGPPAMGVAAVMPMPEGVSELTFAGVLGGRRIRMIIGKTPLPIAAEADFLHHRVPGP